MNPEISSQGREFNAMSMDILSKTLQRASNPINAAEYLAEEIVAATAARCVIFNHCPCASGQSVSVSCVVVLSPASLRERAESANMLRLYDILRQQRTPRVWRTGDSSEAAGLLRAEGYERSLFLPLQGGAACMGAMLVLGLPDDKSMPATLDFLTSLSPIAALMLHNAFLYERQEQIIEARMADLRTANEKLQTELSKREPIEAALRESESKFRTLADFTYDWEFWLTPEGNYKYVSPSCERITGYHPEEFQKNPGLMIAITHPDDRAEVEKHMKDSLVSGRLACCDFVFRILDKNHEEHCIQHVCQAVYSPDGTWLGRRGSNRDVTESKRAEEALRESEEQMRLFFERQIVGMSISSPKMTWLKVNDKLCQMLGYTREELTRQSWITLTHPDDAAISAEQFNRLITGETDEYSLEKRYLRKDGTVIHANLSVGCVRKQDGSLNYVLALIDDITDRKRAEEALKDSQRQLSDIIEFLPDATLVLDNEKRVIAWNKAIEEMTGIAKADILGQGDNALTVPFYGDRRQHLLDLLDVEDAELQARYAHLQRKGGRLYAEVFAPALHGGKGAYLWVTGAPLYDIEGQRVGAIESIRDITERKKMQVDLAEKVTLLEAALVMVRKLEGIIPICMYCKKIRNDRQSWQKMEEYIMEHSEASFSHGMCPECAEKMMKEIDTLNIPE